jgi:hypothetical protein
VLSWIVPVAWRRLKAAVESAQVEYYDRREAPPALSRLHLVLEDGFQDDTVVVRAAGRELLRRDGVTTRTQLSHAGDAEVEVPEGRVTLEVEVPTKGVSDRVEVDAAATPVVGLSLRDGQVVPAFPEHAGRA